MSDGQSAVYIDQAIYRDGARLFQHRDRVRQLVEKVRHGVPPWTPEETIEIVYFLSGERLPIKKRCDKCGGEGVRRIEHTRARFEKPCELCRGKGYLTAEDLF